MLQKQIFEKIAKSQPLNPEEMSEFIKFGELLQNLESLYGGMVITGSQRVEMSAPSVTNPQWQGSPLHSMFLLKSVDVSVVTATETLITWDTVENFGEAFEVSPDKTKFYLRHIDGKAFTIKGLVSWSALGSVAGFRSSHINTYDKNDNLLETLPFHTHQAFAGPASNIFPVNLAWHYTGIDYFKFFVYQNSGSNVTLSGIQAVVSLA